MEKKASTRVYYLDWLRVLAIVLVFVYHSSRFFNMEDWHVKNSTWYPWVEVWNQFAGIWMMPLIFVISGASLFYAVGKGGPGKFIKDRVLRLLVPLVVCALTHASLQVYLERITHDQFSGSYFQFLPHYFQGIYEFGNPASGNFAVIGMHLWYLFWLFMFSMILYPLMRWLKGRGRAALSRLGDLLAFPGAVYALALPTLLLLVFADPDGPVMSEREAGWSLLIYVWLLLSGFIVMSHDRVQESVRRVRWLSLALAVASIVSWLLMIFTFERSAFGTPRYSLAMGLRALSSWWWILAIMGLGKQYLDYGTPFVKYANEGVLPFYILHQTVLLCVGYFVVQWVIPDLLKWAIILVVSFAIIMTLYEFLIRRFKVLRFLFGMKVQTRKPAVQAGEPAVAG
jgi:peptidoglycan/LPS O-acetylase OafA/YrhL